MPEARLKGVTARLKAQEAGSPTGTEILSWSEEFVGITDVLYIPERPQQKTIYPAAQSRLEKEKEEKILTTSPKPTGG